MGWLNITIDDEREHALQLCRLLNRILIFFFLYSTVFPLTLNNYKTNFRLFVPLKFYTSIFFMSNARYKGWCTIICVKSLLLVLIGFLSPTRKSCRRVPRSTPKKWLRWHSLRDRVVIPNLKPSKSTGHISLTLILKNFNN